MECRPVRPRRHGRPGPVGGRFALPGIRFSGAAMAMSTVLGISAATTWLVSAQQHVGRHPDSSTVGGSPPLPQADRTPAQPADAATPGPQAMPGPRALISPSLGSSTDPGAESRHHGSPRPTAPHGSATTAPPVAPVTPRPIEVGTVPTMSPSPTPSPVPTGTGTGTGSPSPTPAPTGPPTQLGPTQPPVTTSPVSTPPVTAPPTGKPTEKPADTLTGQALRETLGPSGTRHTLTLTVGEPMAALQVELRLARPDTLPGITPWNDLPGTVVTVTQERATLIYRFTAPELPPGTYTFGVRGSRTTGTPQETWTASAFAPVTARALATRGTF